MAASSSNTSRDVGVRRLGRAARPLAAIAAGAEADGRPCRAPWPARYPCRGRSPTKRQAPGMRVEVPSEELPCHPVQLRSRRSGRGAGEAEPEAELAQFPQQVVDPRPKLESVEVGDHRLDPLGARARWCPGRRTTSRSCGRGRPVRTPRPPAPRPRRWRPGRPDALHAAGRGDRTLDRDPRQTRDRSPRRHRIGPRAARSGEIAEATGLFEHRVEPAAHVGPSAASLLHSASWHLAW